MSSITIERVANGYIVTFTKGKFQEACYPDRRNVYVYPTFNDMIADLTKQLITLPGPRLNET
jgi:hypothetical protein